MKQLRLQRHFIMGYMLCHCALLMIVTRQHSLELPIEAYLARVGLASPLVACVGWRVAPCRTAHPSMLTNPG
jgi:hypothetical protein